MRMGERLAATRRNHLGRHAGRLTLAVSSVLLGTAPAVAQSAPPGIARRAVSVITVDGRRLRDLDRNGKLDRYEDLRVARAADVAPNLPRQPPLPVAAPVMAKAVDVEKPRVVVLSDIGNEPDDSESFVRFLLYSNSFDVAGIVATTSIHQPRTTQPQLFEERIAAYARVLPNLKRHARGYPEAEVLRSRVRSGCSSYGMTCVGAGKDTPASQMIVALVDDTDPRPLWVSVWGGAADLAQALWHVRATRPKAAVDRFVSRLRIYSISDQDDAGPWARRSFPQLFWIASIHGWGQYPLAAWTGISGDRLRTEKWPAGEMVSDAWLDETIRRGPLGQLYPKPAFIMEGDTPAFLSLIPNGLNLPERPDWGGWGGRYALADPGAAHYADAIDTVSGADGTSFASNQATIFRWRSAFQQDFAARIGWTLTPDYGRANHNPVLMLNGVAGQAPVTVTAASGSTIVADAAGSSDPDGNRLRYRWWQYAEPTGGFRSPVVKFTDPTAPRTRITLPVVAEPTEFHVILEVIDDGTPALTRYRRLVITTK